MQRIHARIRNYSQENRAKKKFFIHFCKEQSKKSLGYLCIFWQIIFFYIPITMLIFRGINGLTLGGNKEIISTFLHYQYLYILCNSILLSAITTMATLLLGFCIAYTLAFHTKKCKKLLLMLIIIPFWTNFALHMYSWFYILQPEGPLNSALLYLHIINKPLNLTNSSFSVYLMMIYYYLPFMLISLYSSFERFDYSLIEASKNLGAKSSTTLFNVLLPLNMKGIRTGIYLVLIPSFGEFIIPEMMGGDKTTYIGNVITTFALGDKTEPESIILTLLSLIAILCIVMLVNKILRKTTRLMEIKG